MKKGNIKSVKVLHNNKVYTVGVDGVTSIERDLTGLVSICRGDQVWFDLLGCALETEYFILDKRGRSK